MMNTEEKLAIIERLDNGELSRNGDFDLFEEPEFASVRRKQMRLKSLADLAVRLRKRQLKVEVETKPLDGGLVRVCVRVPRFGFKWTANMEQFELDLLQSRSETEDLFTR